MAVWDFSDYEYEQVERILYHCEALEVLGIEQDDDMMRELRSAVEEKGNEECDEE